MSDSNGLPRRITWVVVLTAVVSASLFPVGLFNPYSILLIIGTLVQLWLPRLGRWLIWLGAAGLSILVFGIGLLSLQHPVPDHDLGTRVFYWALISSSCALVWCDTELIIDAVTRLRNRRASFQSLNTYEWIFVIVLNLWTLLAAVVAVRGYWVSGNLHAGVTFWAWVLLIVVVDFSIIKNLRASHHKLLKQI